MARNLLLDTSTVNIGSVFANGNLYRVPEFQRDYSWQEENWEDLWNDLTEVHESGSTHYFGAIVLQSTAADRFTVIDGQQRLATVSLLALAVLDRIRTLVDRGVNADENKLRYELLFSQFIGSRDPASLRASSKLTLNKTDDGFYQHFMVQFRQPINPRRLEPSERRMWEAFKYFQQKLVAQFGEQPDGEHLADFLATTVARRLMFIQILVEDELSAYTVFETLNARGTALTASDLLKNYLFSLAAESRLDLEHVQHEWRQIAELVPATDLSGFLRHFLNSSQSYVRSERLFKEIKASVSNRQQVFAFLERLHKAADLYAALDDPEDQFWLDRPDAVPHIRALKLFGVTQYRPLALAWNERHAAQDLERILRICEIVSFRFNVIARRNTQELERAYNQAAIEVSAGRATRPRDVFELLKPVYVSDEEFSRSFGFYPLGLRPKKIQSYTLSRLEAHLRGDKFDADLIGATIEHILPENPSQEWLRIAWREAKDRPSSKRSMPVVRLR
ncbi:MAG: DUF262 domain-containing protein [Acidobacteria bacterium]|nr:DUF262 domain-containing protein [Acidobacteriota bacterium]